MDNIKRTEFYMLHGCRFYVFLNFDMLPRFFCFYIFGYYFVFYHFALCGTMSSFDCTMLWD